MQKVLLTWLGVTDIKSSRQESGSNLGHIAGAVTDRGYKQVISSRIFQSKRASNIKNGWKIPPLLKPAYEERIRNLKKSGNSKNV
jgi:hypothetical protein